MSTPYPGYPGVAVAQATGELHHLDIQLRHLHTETNEHLLTLCYSNYSTLQEKGEGCGRSRKIDNYILCRLTLIQPGSGKSVNYRGPFSFWPLSWGVNSPLPVFG